MSESTVTPLSREQVLTENIIARENEIMMYQINIDNYEWAVANEDFTDDDPATQQQMEEHRDRLMEGIKNEKREKRKSEMILAALEAQLAALQKV